MATNKSILYDFTRLVDVNQLPDSISTTIWMCSDLPRPPTRKTDQVKKHSSMTWTAQIHWDRLPRFVNNEDKEFHELEFQTEMVCSGGATETSVLHKGNRVAKSNLTVKYHDEAKMGA